MLGRKATLNKDDIKDLRQAFEIIAEVLMTAGEEDGKTRIEDLMRTFDELMVDARVGAPDINDNMLYDRMFEPLESEVIGGIVPSEGGVLRPVTLEQGEDYLQRLRLNVVAVAKGETTMNLRN